MRSYKDSDATGADAQAAKDRSPDLSDMELAHDLLHWASELINGVLERNRIGTPLQMISFLSGAKQDADVADAILTGGEVAEALPHVAVADQELKMAERYAGWREGESA